MSFPDGEKLVYWRQMLVDYYDAADHPIRRRLSQAFHEMGAKCSEPQGASIRWV